MGCCSAKRIEPVCCSEVPELSEDSLDRDRTSSLVWRLGVALVLAGQAMVFDLGINASPPEYGSLPYWFMHLGLFSSALLVVGLLGFPLFRDTYKAFVSKEMTLEGLFLLSMLGALGGSLTATITGQGEIYYEVVSIVLIIYTVGKGLGARSRRKAQTEVRKMRQDFDYAYVLGDNLERVKVPIAQLNCCSIVIVGPGGAITVDGIITEGKGYIRDTAMTGELDPSIKAAGDPVLAGSYSIDGTFKIKPTATKGDRRLDSLLSAVEGARLTPSSLQSQADRLMKWFLPLVVTTCIATFIFWFGRASWSQALFNSMAVLLVACPCALGLATPLAVWSGLWKLSTLGLVSRSGGFLDSLARINYIAFDKTGTLSEEELTLAELKIEPLFQSREHWLRSVIYAIESRIDHPVAQAFSLLKPEGPLDINFSHSRVIPGQGVEAELEDGTSIYIGSSDGSVKVNAKKVIIVKVGGELAASAFLEEKLRGGVEDTLSQLKALGVSSTILTGDPAPRSLNISGLSVKYGLSPEEKERCIDELQKAGQQVLYVGDGVNDAPAMSLCEASIAMGGGAALTQSTASAVLMGKTLRVLPEAIALARSIRKNVRGNMFFAATYNILGMTMAAMGKLHPVVAILLMFVSSLCVSIRAARVAKLVPEKA